MLHSFFGPIQVRVRVRVRVRANPTPTPNPTPNPNPNPNPNQVLLHPGFNKTEMTAKYAEIWEKEGAVPTEEGALRVLHETGTASMAKTGMFINCEDGLQIPW